MFLMSVKPEKYDNSLKIASSASCTTNCSAPLVKVICDNFSIVEYLIAIVYATTATKETVDGPSGTLCHGSHRAALYIISASTGAAKAMGKVIPELNKKVTGMAFCVTTPNVFAMDLISCLEKAIKYNDIKKRGKEAF